MSKTYRFALAFFFLAVVFGLLSTAMLQSKAAPETGAASNSTKPADPLPADLPRVAFLPAHLQPSIDLSKTPSIIPVDIERLYDARYCLTNGLTAANGPAVVSIEGVIQPEQTHILFSAQKEPVHVQVVWADSSAATDTVSVKESKTVRVRLTGRLALIPTDRNPKPSVESIAPGTVIWALYDARRVD